MPASRVNEGRLATADSPRVVVFRARMLGEMPCAAPALRALHEAWPRTQLTLVGLPWVRQWAASQPFIDDFVEFPGMIGLPEREPDALGFRQFLAEMRRRRYDLAVQLHGSAPLVNRLVAAFGARHVAGMSIADGSRSSLRHLCYATSLELT